MEILKDKTYIFIFDINGKFLTYTGKVIDIDSNFVSFIDKYGKEYSYSLKTLISKEELEDDR